MARQVAPGIRTPLHTSLPASPLDGQEINYLADSANGVVWRLRYRTASASAYKWEFVGGSALNARNQAGINLTTANVATDLATSVTVPLAGEYDVDIGAYILNAGGAPAMTQASINLKVGAAAPGEPLGASQATNAYGWSVATRATVTVTAAATALALQATMSTAGQTIQFNRCFVRARPVRVG